MPWRDETLVDDAGFLLLVIAEAQNESVLTKLPYDADRDIVIPWIKKFAGLVEHMKNEAEEIRVVDLITEAALNLQGQAVILIGAPQR